MSSGDYPHRLTTNGCAAYWAAYDAYTAAVTERTDAAQTALGAAVNAFNDDVSARGIGQWNEYQITSEKISKTVLQSSSPAQIIAGGAMTIASTGAVVNDNSNIIAGGAINITGASVNNRATQGTSSVVDIGKVRYRRIEHHGGLSDSYSEELTDWSPTTGAPQVSTFTLQSYVYKPNASNPAATRNLSTTNTSPASSLSGASTVTNQDMATGVRPAYASLSTSAQPHLRGQTVMPALTAPNSSLFSINRAPGATYVVETDPRFTNQKAFLSSDYYLNQLNLDPSRQLERYGDGFVEQQLVNDQIMALTGRRYLSGYTSTEAEYQSLMDAGIAYARQYQLSPGVALSANQMTLLTTDIVLLVKQTMTLPDGTTQDVLVPEVYLRHPQEGDLQPTGALIAGSDITIQSAGDLVNSGQIAADNSNTLLAGNDLINQQGRISGQDVVAYATRDLKNLSGSILGQGTGSQIDLSAGRDIVLQTQTITTRTAQTAMTAASMRVNVDRIATIQGGDVSLNAGRDLIGQGSSVHAGDNLLATAGRDITVSAVAGSYELNAATTGHYKGRSGYVKEDVVTNQVASFDAGNNAALIAGGDGQGGVTLTGTKVSAGGSIGIQGANVTIAAAKDERMSDFQHVGAHGYRREMADDQTLAGGTVAAGKDITLLAAGTGVGGDVHLSGAYLHSQDGAITVAAANNVAIDAADTEHSTAYEHYSKRSGLFNTTVVQEASFTHSDRAEAGVISGDTVNIQAGNPLNATGDVSITGSQLVADGALSISAGRNLTITSAQQSAQTLSSYQKKTSGLFSSGGLSVTIGSQQNDQNRESTSVTNVGSTIGSLNGNIALKAGDAYTQTGSAVLAPQGDIDITARTVDINEARNTDTNTFETKFKQSGLTLAVSSPVISAIQTAQQMGQAAGQTSDGRMKALAGMTTGLAGLDAYDAAKAGQGSTINGKDNQIRTGTDADGNPTSRDATAADKVGGINLSISIGGSKSQSKTTQRSNTAAGSTVAAGGNVNISATGAGSDSNLTVQGSDIKAGNNVNLKADGDINLLAAQNTVSQQSTNKNNSASIGVGINFGGNQNGISFQAGASGARGHADGTDQSWINTHISAGNRASLDSGQDTNLIGATVTAPRAVADIGGNLNIESLQDTSRFDSKQQSLGASISLCIPPLCAGTPVSGSISASKSNINSVYASVTEQSGIKAGDQGFDINVKDNTGLKGGVIDSTQAAVDNNSNQFQIGGMLNLSDIQNHADYDANAIGASLGTSVNIRGTYQPSGPSAGIGSDSGRAGSVTQAGISGIAGNKDARTDDKEAGIGKIFDAEKVRKDINAQVTITQAFGQQATLAVKIYADTQRAALRAQLKQASTPEEKQQIQDQINQVNLNERIANVAVGILAGQTGTAITKGVLSEVGDLARQETVRNSALFAGIVDQDNKVLNNLSGESDGVNGDGVKTGGVRLDVVKICGDGRCRTNPDGTYATNEKGQYILQGTWPDLLASPQGKQMASSGVFGGIQGAAGSILGISYAPKSAADHLVESFGGIHDLLGGELPGFYDDQGNTKQGVNSTLSTTVSGLALVPSAPVAMSTLIPTDVWNTVSALMQIVK